MLLAEEAGIPYDPALGGGKSARAAGNMRGVMLEIDPETGYLRAVQP